MTEGPAPSVPPAAVRPAPSSSAPARPGPRPTPVVPEPCPPEPAATEPGDAELLQAHVDGDPEAFATLVARHQDRLWAVALRTMRDPEEAADALQDAYVAAFRRAGTFRGESLVTTWLHRVVVNACLDRLRRSKVRAADPLPADVDRLPRLAQEPVADPVEARERHDEVVAALGRLNPEQRAALVLVDMEGYSVQEAAAMLRCATGTVKSRCARGRARLVPLLRHLRSDTGTSGATAPTARAAP